MSFWNTYSSCSNSLVKTNYFNVLKLSYDKNYNKMNEKINNFFCFFSPQEVKVRFNECTATSRSRCWTRLRSNSGRTRSRLWPDPDPTLVRARPLIDRDLFPTLGLHLLPSSLQVKELPKHAINISINQWDFLSHKNKLQWLEIIIKLLNQQIKVMFTL